MQNVLIKQKPTVVAELQNMFLGPVKRGNTQIQQNKMVQLQQSVVRFYLRTHTENGE